MLAKINSVLGAIWVLALVLLLSGCTPAGPRALFEGKKSLDNGDVAEAVKQFRRATTLLATNATAWDYFGVALQRAGQPDDAATAYQTALRLDRDLVEAHFNLGTLWLEQNKPEAAIAEFTAFTLRRPNYGVGWLKLGLAQLKTGELLPAERSFSTVLSLKVNEAEAYNGLGLARLQGGKPHDAAQFFYAAVRLRPDYAAALENLATVTLQYLHDPKSALADYQAYLALNPRPADYDQVRDIVADFERGDSIAAVPPLPPPTAEPAAIAPPTPATEVKPKASVIPAHSSTFRTESEPARPSHVSQRNVANSTPVPAAVVAPVPTQTVLVEPETDIVAAPKAPSHARTSAPPATESPEVPASETDQTQPGLWHRVVHPDKPSESAQAYHRGEVVTPLPSLPSGNEEMAGTKPEQLPPEAMLEQPKPPPPPAFPRYQFTSPARPPAGDRRKAEGPFTKARLAEQDQNWAEAAQWYETAADEDPSWFEAQYNAGVITHRLHKYSVALPRYEMALAIQPNSVDARYNFALALRMAGFAPDAADELRKILAANPDDVHAHLALANLCAQALHDAPQARQHYLRVLALQPNHPQAADIRFWLSANAR
jgi:tetratricopeptide (TPR) repeat protein